MNSVEIAKRDVEEFNKMTEEVISQYDINKEVGESVKGDMIKYALTGSLSDALNTVVDEGQSIESVRDTQIAFDESLLITEDGIPLFTFPVIHSSNYFTSVNAESTVQVLRVNSDFNAKLYIKIYWRDGKIINWFKVLKMFGN
jgi:hypothetical protein